MARQDLSFNVVANARGVVSQFGQIANSAKSLQRTVTVAAGAIGGIAAAYGLSRVVSDVAGLATAAAQAELANRKLAHAVGETSANIAALNEWLGDSGIAAETSSAAMVKLLDSVAEAAKGTDAAQDAFAALGLSFESIQSQSPAEALETVLASLADVESTAQRVDIARTLLGKGGAELLAAQVGGLKEAQEATRAWGFALSEVDSQRLFEANDAIGDMWSAIKGAALQVATSLSPYLQVAARWVEWITVAITSGLRPAMEVWLAKSKGGFLGLLTLAGHLHSAWQALRSVVLASAASTSASVLAILASAQAVADLVPALRGSLDDAASSAQTLTATLAEDAVAAWESIGRDPKWLVDARNSVHDFYDEVNETIGGMAAKAEQFSRTAGRGIGEGFEDGVGKVEKSAKGILDDWRERAKQIRKDIRSPMEVLADQLIELDSLLDLGLLSWDEYTKAVLRAGDSMESFRALESPAAVEAGTVAAYSATRLKDDSETRRAEQQRRLDSARQLAESKRQTELLARIERAELQLAEF